ncbi:TIGR00266 family protein [Massilia sp. W12]|uniref:TIGR00266 family protein n=1 Tax=Massilia sp. W12 TaxID=3126507 RepID=UPI0030CDF9C4
MKSDIKGGTAFSYVDMELAPGEVIITESDAMSSMDADMEMKAIFNGGLFKGLLRKYLGGESLFLSRYANSASAPRRITFVQPTPGQIREIELAAGESLYLQPGAFLACSESVTLGLSFAGLISWIAREGLFRLEAKGPGKLWYGAYGALLDRQIKGEYIVDTSHLVAYDKNIKLKLQFAGGLFSSLFGGEGLVLRLEGEGRAVIQTRSMSGLANWVNPKL